MDINEILLNSLPVLAKLTDGFVAITDRDGIRIKVIDSDGNPIPSLENRKLEIAARALQEKSILSGPSELAHDAQIWAIPLGQYALVVTEDGKKQKQVQLEYSLKESLAHIANVIGGEASLFDQIGTITDSVNRDGSFNEHLIGSINKDAYTSMSINKSMVSESQVIPGARSILIPITKQVGLELSKPVEKEKIVEDKRDGQAKYSFADIIGKSEQITKTKKLCEQAARSISPVLLLGQSGTGKELFAHAIHNESERSGNPFIALNCGAIPGNLIESLLFGYEGGTFTGASQAGKKGLILEAHKGTLFLDEIGEMDYVLQSRLLRVLQEKEVMAVGSTKSKAVDIRIIAATNKDLPALIAEGKFREDLYYRLNVFPIDIPSLHDRKEDIELLVHHFIKDFNVTLNKRITGCSRETMKVFQEFKWPGNIRQLRNCMERIANIVDSGVIEVHHLPEYVFTSNDLLSPDFSIHRHETLDEAIKRIEKELIERTLAEMRYNKQEAARRLGISTTTLWRKINNMEADTFKRIK